MSTNSEKKPTTSGTVWAIVIFAAILCFAGSMFLQMGVSRIYNAKRSASWPTAEGKVLSSSVKGKWNTSIERNTYYAEVSYRYSVEGQEYTNNQISFGKSSSGDRERARKKARKFKKGRRVDVIFNPQDPQQSVLESGTNPMQYLSVGVGALLLITAVRIFPKKKDLRLLLQKR